MSTSDETLKKSPDTEAILQAIAQLSESIASVVQDVSVLKSDVSVLKTDVNEVRADLHQVRLDLGALTQRVDGLEKFVTVQFDAVREGIEYNSPKFDRLQAKIYNAHSDISNMRADIKELAQLVRKKELV